MTEITNTSAMEFAQEPCAVEVKRADKVFTSDFHFLLSAPTPAYLPSEDRIEVCITGRSNVGKSTIINALANRRKLARASNTPGRTREINIFTLGNKHYIADLPGYGYARMPKKIAAQAAKLIESYITKRSTLRRVLLLIDCRRGVKEIDELFMIRLDEAGVSYQIVLTKQDKVNLKELTNAKASVSSALASHPALFPEAIVTSAKKGTGINTLRCQILGIS